MILASFGDSFIYGTELNDTSDDHADLTSNLTYPALLAKNYNLSYVCRAWPGIGNMQIAERILGAVNTYGNSAFYFINWTWIERFDYVDQHFVAGPVDEGRYGFSKRWRTVRPSLDNHNVDSFYYKHLHSEELDKLTSLINIYNSIAALESCNACYIMTYMDDLMFDKKYHCTPAIDFLQNQIQPKMQYFENMNFLDWSKKQGYKIGPGNHPLEHAHEKAAEYWSPKMRTLLNTHAKEDYLHAFI